MKISYAPLFAGVLTIQAAAAETVTYNCMMTKQDGHGWIAPEYAFQIDSASGASEAASSYHDWAEAKLKDRGAKGYRILWNITAPLLDGTKQRVKYQANLNAQNDTVKVRMSWANANYTNKPFGVGTCSKVQ
ncbi:hypothetical protein [uncultured Ruegeria sp.]|uniref:hypothetical protein n=1 Tax=uncultured Ruegeria sp. TaxID=259304 RepID=UPI00260DDA38|nr:hypothetical protein [uncultured Ruegeria sp.]